MNMYYPRDIARNWREYNKNTCFILMPFDDKFRKVFSAIRTELKKIDFLCTRVDLEDQDGAIINRIVKGIISSHFVIVDLSEKNPNVFYELGLSHALKDNSNVILIAQNIEDVPFDIRHLRIILYDMGDMFSLVERVRKQIDANKHGFDIKLALKGRYGHLLHNESEMCDLEDFFEPFLTDFPSILINITGSSERLPFESSQAQTCLNKIKNGIEFHVKNGGRIGKALVKVYSDLLVTLQRVPFIQSEIRTAMGRGEIAAGFSEKESVDHVMNLVFGLVDQDPLRHEAVDWIIAYLSRPKVAGVDIARSKVEEFVVNYNSHELNKQMIKVLSSDTDLQRENISDILGEIGDPCFAENLGIALTKESNYYAARSMITALGRIGLAVSGIQIMHWLNGNIQTIINTNSEFVFHYTGPALSLIDYKNGTSFVKEFNQLLTSYGVVRTGSK